MNRLVCILLLSLCSLSLRANSDQDTLIVAYTPAPPFLIVNDGELRGLNIWLWERIADDLQLKFVLKEMSFSEILTALENGSIDLCINPLTVTSERSRKIDFTHPYFASNSTGAIKESSSLTDLTYFLKSFFNLNFLRAFFALLLLISIFGLALWFFERKVNQQEFRPGVSGIWDGLWWSVVTMTTVGYGDKSPKSRGGKITALIWMFSGLLFISGLTASVASLLTINNLNSNTGVVSDYKTKSVGCVKNTSTSQFLRTQFFKDIKLYDTVVQGLHALNDDQIDAFLYDEPILKYRMKQDPAFSQLQVFESKFDLQLYAFGLSKNQTALRDKISQKVLTLTESMEWHIVLNEFGLEEI